MSPDDDETLLREALLFAREGTLLDRIACSAADTARLWEGGGGSHVGGVPYLEDEAPRCRHDRAMRCELQIDGRDALHAGAFAGLFVVFACGAAVADRFAALQAKISCEPVVRYHSAPAPQRRHITEFDPDEGAVRLVPTTTTNFLPPQSLIDAAAPELASRLEKARLHEPWGRVYWRVMRRSKMDVKLYEDHLGGWHATNSDRNHLPPRCPACGEAPRLAASLAWGDGNKSLWACQTHPDCAHFAFHK